jgi:hypothetical protein
MGSYSPRITSLISRNTDKLIKENKTTLHRGPASTKLLDTVEQGTTDKSEGTFLPEFIPKPG